MHAAKPATFRPLGTEQAVTLYARIAEIAEKDSSLASFDDELARFVSEEMVTLFLDPERLDVQDVEQRIKLLFRNVITRNRLEAREAEKPLVNARRATEEALQKAYQNVSTPPK